MGPRAREAEAGGGELSSARIRISDSVRKSDAAGQSRAGQIPLFKIWETPI
jgi:hypothetical protein